MKFMIAAMLLGILLGITIDQAYHSWRKTKEPVYQFSSDFQNAGFAGLGTKEEMGQAVVDGATVKLLELKEPCQ